MQGAPKHGPQPGPLLPKACSVALGQSEDPLAAELANAGEGAVPPDHQFPWPGCAWELQGPVRCPVTLGTPTFRVVRVRGKKELHLPVCIQRLRVLTPPASCLTLAEASLLLGSLVSWKGQV